MIPKPSDIAFNQVRIIRTYKQNAAYLVSYKGSNFVMKAENASIGKKNDEGDRLLRDSRADYLRGKGQHYDALENSLKNNTPQVKMSIAIMSDIWNYVTGDLGEIYTLDSGQTVLWSARLRELNKYDGDPYRCVWYTMQVYSHLENLEILAFPDRSEDVERNHRPRQVMQRILPERVDLYKQLGRITAVDCFICNADRFQFAPGLETMWVNIGNVFLTWDGDDLAQGERAQATFRFIGVDFFDNQQTKSCFFGIPWEETYQELTVSRRDDKRRAKAHFDALLAGSGAEQKRRQMADELMESFITVTELNGPIRRSLMKDNFFEGMNDGREKLIQFFKKRIAQDRWPSGLASRFRAIL